MVLEKLLFEYYLNKFRKIDSNDLFNKKTKRQLNKMYELAMLLDEDDCNYETAFINSCSNILDKLEYKQQDKFARNIYNLILNQICFKLLTNNDTCVYKVIEDEKFLECFIDFIIKSKDTDLLFSILRNGFFDKNLFGNSYLINNITCKKNVITAILKYDPLNIDKITYIIKNYKNLIDLEKLINYVCFSNAAYFIYAIARVLNEEGYNDSKLEDAIIEAGNLDYIIKFALDINGCNVPRLEQYTLNSKSRDHILKFYDIPGANIEKIREYIINSNDDLLIYRFLINYYLDLDLIKILINNHNYDLLYRLKYTKEKELNQRSDLLKIINDELISSDCEIYVCTSMLEDDNVIKDVFGTKENMLIFLANKYCEEHDIKWMKLYELLKKTMNFNNDFDGYQKFIKKNLSLS